MIDNNYFLIRRLEKDSIELLYFYDIRYTNNLYKYPLCFIINDIDFNSISILLSAFSYIHMCSTEHKMYLGKEIYKLKLCIMLDQPYFQN